MQEQGELLLIEYLTAAGFSAALASDLAHAFDPLQSWSKGTYFIRPGERCARVGLLQSGICRYYYVTEKGEDVTRWCSLSGDFVTSLPAFIRQQPATEYIEFIKPGKMWMLSLAKWQDLYLKHEELRHFWLKTMEDNYIGMEERVYNLIARNAAERYAWFQQWQPRMLQEVPDEYMAAMLGIQPRHLSRLRGVRKL